VGCDQDNSIHEKFREVLQHRHLMTHSALSSADIQPPLYFPVRKPVSNEAKNRGIYFRVRRSFSSYFDMKLHYIVNTQCITE